MKRVLKFSASIVGFFVIIAFLLPRARGTSESGVAGLGVAGLGVAPILDCVTFNQAA